MRFKMLLFCLLVLFLDGCSNELSNGKNKEKHDIDWETFKIDLSYFDEIDNLPLGFGVFPVNKYDSEGNGGSGNMIIIDGDSYFLQSVFVYRGEYNKRFFDGMDDNDNRVYYSILVQTDYQDSLNDLMVTSRNHPNYLSQGIISYAEDQQVRWLACQNNERKNSDFAVVNMKYYNLEEGRLIVITPQADGSLRSQQLKLKKHSYESNEELIKAELLASKRN